MYEQIIFSWRQLWVEELVNITFAYVITGSIWEWNPWDCWDGGLIAWSPAQASNKARLRTQLVWNEWVGEWVGVSWFCWSCYPIHANMWVRREGEEDRSSKLNLLKKWLGTRSVGSLDGPRDHWFWENWFRERGLI
jgi:hypothetical protein